MLRHPGCRIRAFQCGVEGRQGVVLGHQRQRDQLAEKAVELGVEEIAQRFELPNGGFVIGGDRFRINSFSGLLSARYTLDHNQIGALARTYNLHAAANILDPHDGIQSPLRAIVRAKFQFSTGVAEEKTV
jgi:hypothetical protein